VISIKDPPWAPLGPSSSFNHRNYQKHLQRGEILPVGLEKDVSVDAEDKKKNKCLQ
jgi:hypothetical protein